MDPNEIVGQPRYPWVWLAPDWSDYRESEARPANTSGWTRVKIRETLHQDGRITRHVLDASGAPVAEGGAPAGGTVPARELDPTPQYDKNQAQRWKDLQAQTARGDQEGDVRPSSGPTREVYRGGKWVVEPNPTYQAPASQNPDTPENKNAAELQRQREKNAALADDPAYETDKERRDRADARIKQQGADAKAAEDKARQERIDADAAAARNKPSVSLTQDGTQAVITYPDGRVESKPTGLTAPPKPGTTLQVHGSDGKTYLVPIDAQGRPGTPQALNIPGTGPDTPTTAGPSQPQIVLGMSQDAVREYYGKLQEGVAAGRWSQKWADDRKKEFYEMAQLAVQEAKTQQYERESTRNAEINLATSRATLGQNMVTTSAGVVDKLNGYLDENSTLGGQAFAAMLGIGMLMQARSGIDSIDPSGRRGQPNQQPAVAPLTPAELANPDALAAKRAEIMAHPVFRPQPPVDVASTPRAVATAPSAGAVPGAAAPSPTSAPAAPMTAEQAAGYYQHGVNPATGEPTNLVPPPMTGAQAAAYEAGGVNPATGDIDVQGTPSPFQTMPDTPANAAGMVPEPIPVAPNEPPLAPHDPRVQPLKQAAPDYGAPMPAYPGGPPAGPIPRVLPPPMTPPTQYGEDQDMPKVGMSPYPVLAQYQQPQFEPPPAGNGPVEDVMPLTPGARLPFDRWRPQPGIRNAEGVDVTNNMIPQPPPGPVAPWDRDMDPNMMMKAAPSPYPVLANYPAPSVTGSPAPTQPGAYPAALHSEAAQRAPWEMDPARIQEMIDAGIPESEIFAVPGRRPRRVA